MRNGYIMATRTMHKKDSSSDAAASFAPDDCAIVGCIDIGTSQIAVYDDYSDSIIPCFICEKHYKELMLRYYDDIGGKNKGVLKERVH
jgi:hypothetical protein